MVVPPGPPPANPKVHLPPNQPVPADPADPTVHAPNQLAPAAPQVRHQPTLKLVTFQA